MVDDRYEGFRKSYRWLFSLPSLWLVLLYNILLLLVAIFLGLLKGYELNSLLVALASIAIPFTVTFIIDRRVLTLKRLLGLYSIYLVFLFPVILLGKQLLLATIPFVLLSFLVFLAIARRTALASFLAAYLSTIYFLQHQFLLYVIIPVAVYITVAFPILYNINRRVKLVAGVGGLKYLRSFLRYTLAGEKKEVEECLSAAAVKKTVPIHVFELYSDGALLGRIVVSGVHPGPLRTLGSSTLPEAILEKCHSALFLKAPAGHGENLALSRDVEKVAEKVCGETSRAEQTGSATLGVADGKLVRSISLRFSNGVSLCLLDPQVSMEDLPATLREEFEEDHVVVADLHNMIDDNFIQLPEDPQENPELHLDVKQTILESLRDVRAEGVLKAGLARVKYSDKLSVGKGGISCAVFSIDDKKLAIVSVDGNNMDPVFKALVNRELASGLDYLLLATTDTHVMTGLFQGVDYYPVGSLNKEQILRNIRDCLLEASQNLKECRVSYRVVPVNALFMDGSKLKGLSRVTRLNVRDGLLLAMLALLSLPILLLLL
ncbi:MAG: DUF2070 family protein [Infirmifilum sp.]